MGKGTSSLYMIHQLPNEILYKIFTQLNFKHRLVCLGVCHNWRSVLESGCFYDVTLYEHFPNQFNSLMQMFRERPDRGAQVEDLRVELRNETDFNRRELLDIFPNARKLIVEFDMKAASLLECSHFSNHLGIVNSSSKVETLHDFNYCELMLQMLHSGLCGQLKTLELDFCFLSTRSSNIVRQLNDLMMLTRLYFHVPVIDIDDLEVLHNNIPTIEDFTLESIVVHESTVPDDISPATAINTLRVHINNVVDILTHVQFYIYLNMKYPNVTTFDHEDKLRYDFGSAELVVMLSIINNFLESLAEGGCNVIR